MSNEHDQPRKRTLTIWRFAFATIALVLLVGFAGCQLGIPDRIARAIISNRFQAFPEGRSFADLPDAKLQPLTNQNAFRTPAEFLVATSVWPVHLEFTREKYLAMAPEKIPPLRETHAPDGSRRLRNPQAQRPGMLGVFGLHLPWSEATSVDVNGAVLWQVAARYKGNGTFIEAMRDYKRSFKLDFNDKVSRQSLAGLTQLNLNNLSQDVSFLNEALAAEYYRNIGVPAARTTFGDVALSIAGEASKRRLGLYLLVEEADANWLKERTGRKEGALWKPVIAEIFEYRGDDWAVYEGDYQPKTKLTSAHKERLVRFSNLVSQGTDAEFTARLNEFLDIEDFARFLAAEVLTSNYDSFIGLGQNFLLYIDPKTDRFRFAPWDLDHSWGEFFLVGSKSDKQQASIWKPFVSQQKFLVRVLAVPKFRELYQAELERQLRDHFVPEKLFARIDELAGIVRPHLDTESKRRIEKFERAVGPATEEGYSLKQFIIARRQSVRDQLDGKTEGRDVKRRAFF